MTDDKTNRGQPDRDRINRNEAYEVTYWTKELGVSKEQLLAAIDAVGPMVKDVCRKLGK